MHIALPKAFLFSIFSTSPTVSHGFSTVTPFTSQYRHQHHSIHQEHRPSSRSTSCLNVFFGGDDDFSDDDDLNNNNDDDNNSNNIFDVEKARKRLEATVVIGNEELQESFFEEMKMRTSTSTTTTTLVRSPTFRRSPPTQPSLDVALPPASPLTSIERERRDAEIQLLGRLAEGDDTVSDLWTLWFGERGSEAAQKLLQAEELTNESNTGGPHQQSSRSRSWSQAEDILRGLIEEHGVYWVEPVNRLATLYYMQGRLDEAETLNKVVLAVKPWHFGALSGIVMIYAAQKDSEKARLWAASRLPTFAPNGANRRRIAWAEKAVQSAEESLENAEKRLQDMFGAPDDYSELELLKDDSDDGGGEDGDGAWQ